MRVTSNQKRQILQAYINQGASKEAAKVMVSRSSPEVLQMLWASVSKGLDLPMGRPGPQVTGAQRVVSKVEAKEVIARHANDAPVPTAPQVKSVLFSFKIGTDDLDSLRDLSERDGESVAVLLRQAVRDYLRAKGIRR